jgi:hypothetical protein
MPPITPPLVRRRRRASVNVRWSEPMIAGLAMINTSQPGRSAGLIALSASRSRRRTRFRTTADPSTLPVARPKRVAPRSVRRIRAASSGCDRYVPRSWIAAKSCGRESITSRGGFGPRSIVRPTGASDLEPGAPPERDVRPLTSCGLGSRAPWRGGASWAGRSASSSGWRAILSIRPWGIPSGFCPQRHANAPVARTGRGASVVRGMIGPPGKGCQTSRTLPRAAAKPAAVPTSPLETIAETDTPWEYRRIALRRPRRGAIFRHPGSPHRSGIGAGGGSGRPPSGVSRLPGPGTSRGMSHSAGRPSMSS